MKSTEVSPSCRVHFTIKSQICRRENSMLKYRKECSLLFFTLNVIVHYKNNIDPNRVSS